MLSEFQIDMLFAIKSNSFPQKQMRQRKLKVINQYFGDYVSTTVSNHKKTCMGAKSERLSDKNWLKNEIYGLGRKQ